MKTAMQPAPVNVEEYAVRRRPEIGQRVRAARGQSKWTQEDIAQYLGCSRRRVNRVEAGITEFTVFELELLAQVFAVPASYFLDSETVARG
jgi:transcriptional regulator with XRE-family HTH domain